MTSPYQRRGDPQPIARWETATALVGMALIGVALAALLGLGAASAVWGGGWVWPHGTGRMVHVIAGILRGQPGRGLPRDRAVRVAPVTAVYACIGLAELMLIATAVIGGLLVATHRRPGDVRGGMATRREARQALGRGQLRRVRTLIRPDLYETDTHRSPRTRPR